ncbi:MAG TPA: alpha/beta hydrolase [Candidatus Baltobacteraceae bacterium]|nr:alpha/beta hydrolase [Candidatus Baltobacteraceae bacterium]
MARLEHVHTSVLSIAFEQAGPADGHPVMLLHGFPYDPRAFDDVTVILNAAGFRTIVPYLRGFGKTRFLAAKTMRSGQQAALGHDLIEMLDALKVKNATLAGFDWGGRAACIVAALWPDRVRGLITCCGYQIQNILTATQPADPESELRWWYQYYFHTERGRAGLTANRNELCRLLWKLWSPTWAFDEMTFNRTAASFMNPDFVDVVVHSYRHRHGNAERDPRYAATEARLAAQPKICVPTIAIHGVLDGVIPPQSSAGHEGYFNGRYERRLLENAGHNPPQELPKIFAQAVIDLCPH